MANGTDKAAFTAAQDGAKANDTGSRHGSSVEECPAKEVLIDIPIGLSYSDPEATPAIKIPYRITFKDGEVRENVLDDTGKALETAENDHAFFNQASCVSASPVAAATRDMRSCKAASSGDRRL